MTWLVIVDGRVYARAKTRSQASKIASDAFIPSAKHDHTGWPARRPKITFKEVDA